MTRARLLLLLTSACAMARADAPDEVRSAIRDLGDAQFDTREKASRILLERGAEAPDAVIAQLPLQDKDLEIRERAEGLKKGIPFAWRRRQALRFAEGKAGLEGALKAFFESGAVDALVKEAQASGFEGALMLLVDRMDSADPKERPALSRAMLRLSEKGGSALALAFRALGGDDVKAKSEVRVNGKPADRTGVNRWAFQRVVEAIAPSLTSRTEETLWSAAGPEASRAAAALLVPLLGSEDPNVVGRIAGALVRLGDRSVLPEVAKFLEKPSRMGRGYAVHVLGDLKATEYSKALLALLKDPVPDVAQSAALALGKMGAKEAIPGLLALLEAGDRNGRAVAARALADLGERSAIPLIARTFLDEGTLTYYPGVGSASMGKILGEPWAEDAKGVAEAKAWWAAHKDDPEFAAKK